MDAHCAQHYDDGHRAHLGGSVIGERCLRKLWYAFRWMHREQFDGRMQRLFNRGHLEELRIIEWLRGIGSVVYDVDAKGKQFRIIGCDNHFGGALDGAIMLPVRYNLPFIFLTEFKTHNDKSFKKLAKVGLIEAKPMHYDQMCTYGSEPIYNLDYGIYFAMNKNDDDIYIEVIELDHVRGRRNVETKANGVIHSDKPPGRISASAAYSDCLYCSMSGICHKGEPIDKNCRSCRNAKPVENGEWFCSHHAAIIPKDYIANGCDVWNGLEQ